MKETLRIIMFPALLCLCIFALLVTALSFVFGDDRRPLCDKAVATAMKGKVAYKLLEVIADEEEGPKEGRGISVYKYIYRYYTGPLELHIGGLECTYVDDGRGAVHIDDKDEIELP